MSLSREFEYSWLQEQTWYVEHCSRDEAISFLAKKDKRRFIVRASSVPGTLALTHKLPNGEIGHCLIQRRTKGWEISQSPDQFHGTLQELLDSMSLRFPANEADRPTTSK
jgi:hypothetical protein